MQKTRNKGGNTPGARAGAAPHPLLDTANRLIREGKPKAAADALVELAGKLDPARQAGLLTRAAGLLRQEDRERALQLAGEAVRRVPELASGWLLLAQIQDERRNRKGAVAAALRVLQSKASPTELVEAGRQLSRLGENRQGLAAVRRGYEESGRAIGLAAYTLRVALQAADWDLSEQITARLRDAHASGRTREAGETPRTHLLWCADEATNIGVISAFAEKTFPARAPMVTAAWPDGEKRKLRVGYLSYDFREHATSLLALGMMRHHDHERFELFGYCTSYDDGSAMRRDILSRFDHVRSLAKLNDQAAARRIVEDRIDVLVDLNGLTEGTRHGILAWRPAPVQISYLGYPGTAGGRFVDYIVGDPYTVPPGAEALYPERVIRIPHSYQINDFVARYLPPLPARRPAGLAPGVPVIGMFNNVNKVGREVWSAWMEILSAVPTAVLWMLDPGEPARENLREAARKAAGVDVARIVFAPKLKHEPHLARLQYCDLILDPWPYGGHTTTSDALFAGIPVVAIEGSNFASRVSGGLLKAAGLGSLVQQDVAAYVRCAVSLLQKPEELARCKAYLRNKRRSLPVFDAVGRTRHLEAAYLAAYRRSASGLPPQHLTVRVQPPVRAREAA